jgi:8-oxo-dGTP pyrophosphatase MutT (NUDIX family)
MLTRESSTQGTKPAKASTAPSKDEERQMLGHLSKEREERDSYSSKSASIPRSSAVLLPLCLRNNIPSILFIKRTSKRGSHRGQIAFPGGLFDPEDNNDPVKCALREMTEEIGLPSHYFDILGLHHDAGTSDSSKNKDTNVTKSTIITPVIGMLKHDLNDLVIDRQIKLSVNELDYIFTVPLETLMDIDRWETYRMRPSMGLQHSSIDELILPERLPTLSNNTTNPLDINITGTSGGKNDNGIEYIMIDKDEYDKLQDQIQPKTFTPQNPPDNRSLIRITIPNNDNPDLIKTISKLHNIPLTQPQSNTNPQSILLDSASLSLSQLQYLHSFESTNQIIISEEYSININPSANTNQILPQTRVFVPNADLLWGATAHITNLFVKQILLPIYSDDDSQLSK